MAALGGTSSSLTPPPLSPADRKVLPLAATPDGPAYLLLLLQLPPKSIEVRPK